MKLFEIYDIICLKLFWTNSNILSPFPIPLHYFLDTANFREKIVSYREFIIVEYILSGFKWWICDLLSGFCKMGSGPRFELFKALGINYYGFHVKKNKIYDYLSFGVCSVLIGTTIYLGTSIFTIFTIWHESHISSHIYAFC